MNQNVPFLPYGRQWISEEDIKAVSDVLRSDFLTQGPAVEQFERDICNLTGAKYCVAVANATAALHIAVAALDIPAGSEGITSSITFVASSNALVYNNIKPVFADIDPSTYCVSPVQIREKITEKTRILIPVHFAGQPADMESIQDITRPHGCRIIEDAAHAIGSKYKNGKMVGSCCHSDMTVFSFHPVKTITTGEGGAITTNSPDLYKKLCLLRSHGITRKTEDLSKNPGPWYYEMQSLGFNYRMTDMQAALGSSQLKRLDAFKARRIAIIQRYNDAFKGLLHVTVPYQTEGLNSCFHLYVLKLDYVKIGISRPQFMERLKEAGVGSQVLYIPVHTQPYYQDEFGYKQGDFPVSEAYYEQALSLPLFPKMSDDDVERVVSAVKLILTR